MRRVATVLTVITMAIGPAAPVPAGENRTLTAFDAAVDAGLYQVTRSWSAAAGDFDGDGWTDLLLGVHGDGPARLYRNDRGRFLEVHPGMLVERDRHGCAWGDVDQDDRLDLYCTVGAGRGAGIGANELWMQQPDGTFVDRAQDYGVTDPYGRGRRAVFLDVNHDPYPDLFVANDYPRLDGLGSPNRLFINEGGQTFRPSPEHGLDVEMGGRCVAARDVDRDGWDDLLVCGEKGDGLRLFRNESGRTFRDVTASVGIVGDAKRALLADLDRDGWLDLVRLTSSNMHVQFQANGRFGPPVGIVEQVSDLGAVGAGDANGDGAVDLFVVRDCPPTLTPNLPDLLLLNAGDGGTFTAADIPQTSLGCGDDAVPTDVDDDGREDFIVTNGLHQNEQGEAEGPVQLVTLQPSPMVRVTDDSFSPGAVPLPRGGTVEWSFVGPGQHTVTDSSGLGLFDSGARGPGSTFAVTLGWAGRFRYLCVVHPWMTGAVRVPVGVAPALGDVATAFTVQWAAGRAPPNLVFDVQVERPGGSWTPWLSATGATMAAFTADAGTGIYGFRARLRDPGTGAATLYSVPARVRVA